jgi:hypothetical protein
MTVLSYLVTHTWHLLYLFLQPHSNKMVSLALFDGQFITMQIVKISNHIIEGDISYKSIVFLLIFPYATIFILQGGEEGGVRADGTTGSTGSTGTNHTGSFGSTG